MNKFKYYFVLLLVGIAIISCSKKDDDDVVVTPVRDYAEQYKADNDSIVKFLKSNYITVTANFDVTISKLPTDGSQVSIWDQIDYPLEHRDVYSRDVTYRVYYLTLRQGVGESPCNFDAVKVSYTGTLLNGTQFDSSYGVARDLDLNIYALGGGAIDGWGEIMPKFRVGTQNGVGSDGTITYDNYGAGVMFLPSGLGYYASNQGTIPSYSPLVFSFKLFDLKRGDNEYTASNGSLVILGDGIPSYLEDLNGDGYLYDPRDTARYPNLPKELIEDTDGDGIPDFLDFDDDGDGYSTRFEVTKPTGAPVTGISLYYPYDPVVDNPATPNVDETEIWGVPRRPTGELTDPSKAESITNPRKFVPEDYTAPGRKRIYLDNTYPYQKN